ncbi:lysozyme [Vibrio cholerae]|uniref:lysozyme n=1 Tax=Vibrio cholerae TaxID=666 RepID=UPI000E0BE488|nr:lysozyme [Vibrio cholerae]EJL6329851.1 lysozyme [Vibrio cholerae]EJL6470720.1 lysozyme [Vibrio cholerae]EJL6716747.1 lysozyme [Vibrio cholerae]EKF9635361.1 lysozyme [Vibrio cholerae]
MKITKKIWCSVAAVISLITGGAIVGQEYIQPVGEVVIEGQALGELRISPKGLEMTGNAEGCRLDPYTCPSGLVTNGVGNTHGVPDNPVSLEQVAKDWVRNLQEAERCVESVERASGKPMTQGQFDAFTSFAFNTGCQRYKRNSNRTATQIYRLSLEGNYPQACAELKRWVYGGGVKQPGLIIRRNVEYERCMALD